MFKIIGIHNIKSEVAPVGHESDVDNRGNHVERHGRPHVYDTGKEAAAFARRLNEAHYWIDYSVRPFTMTAIEANRWKDRERRRFAEGVYIPCIWANEPWARYSPNVELFAHVSQRNPEKITYTENPQKGFSDIQSSPVLPGRFLKRFYGHTLNGRQISDWAARHQAKHGDSQVLQFAKTADEIQQIYEMGPGSCMAHGVEKFYSKIHPCRVYGGGDLQVAYIKRRGRITARCVVWPKKKQNTTIYGDCERMLPMLQKAGYTYGDLNGARILKIVHKKKPKVFVMPYLDVPNRRCTETAKSWKFLTIDQGGEIHAGGENGISGGGWCCPHCEEYRHEGDSSYVCNEDTSWCYSCVQEYTFYCNYEGHQFSHNYGYTHMANGDIWNDSAFDQYGFYCDRLDGNYPHEYAVEMESGERWHRDAFTTYGAQCAVTGENHDREDMNKFPGDVWVHEDSVEEYRQQLIDETKEGEAA